MKTPFTYQLIALKVICAIPIIFIVFLLEIYLGIYIQSDAKYYILCIILALFVLGIYYRCTEPLTLFRQTGYYFEQNGDVYIQLRENAKPQKVDKIQELFVWNSSLLGSKQTNLLIKSKGRKKKFHSIPRIKGEALETTDIFSLFCFLQMHTENMKQQNDVWGNPINYWYKVKEV